MSLRRSPLVPSLTVLRVLRDLAVASSVAAGAVFVEDRRRSIRELSRMAHSARMLKSSVRYDNGGIDRIEELARQARIDEAEVELVQVEASLSSTATDLPVLRRIQGYRQKLLKALWWATNDLPQTKALFERFNLRFHTFRPSRELFDQIIKYCVSARDEQGAEAYLRQMQEDYGLKPAMQTLGPCLLMCARRRDWERVDQGLMDLQRFRDHHYYQRNLAELFGPLLLEYDRQYGLEMAQAYVRDAMDRFGLVPDRYISDIILAGLALEGSVEAMQDWLVLMKPLGVKFDGHTLQRLLKGYWYYERRSPEPKRMKRLVSVVRQLDPCLVTRDCLYLLEDFTRTRQGTQGDRRRGFLRRLPSWTDQALEAESPGTILRRKMKSKIQLEGKPGEALRLFKEAQAKGVKMSPAVVGEAIAAALKMEPSDLTEVRSLLKLYAPGEESPVALAPLIFNRAGSIVDLERIYRVPFEYYAMLEGSGAPIVHSVTRHVANLLLDREEYPKALEMLEEARASRWAKATPFDITCLTVLLKTYGKMLKLSGIWSVVEEVLERDLTIDNVFQETMHRIAFQIGPNFPTRNCKSLRVLYESVVARKEEQAARVRARLKSINRSLVAVVGDERVSEVLTSKRHSLDKDGAVDKVSTEEIAESHDVNNKRRSSNGINILFASTSSMTKARKDHAQDNNMPKEPSRTKSQLEEARQRLANSATDTDIPTGDHVQTQGQADAVSEFKEARRRKENAKAEADIPPSDVMHEQDKFTSIRHLDAKKRFVGIRRVGKSKARFGVPIVDGPHQRGQTSSSTEVSVEGKLEKARRRIIDATADDKILPGHYPNNRSKVVSSTPVSLVSKLEETRTRMESAAADCRCPAS